MNAVPASSASAASYRPLLEVSELSAGYDRGAVLRDVQLELRVGEWLVMVGPNGTGKTTLLYCIAGLLQPLHGEICIEGVSLTKNPVAAKRALGFGCAPERLPPLLTGWQCLQVHAAARQLDELDAELIALAETFGIIPRLDEFVDAYSTGTRQKLAVLLALVGQPRLLVLDEAFNGLDPASALALKQHLRERVNAGRAGVLLATHALDIVERYADRAILLLGGQVVREWRSIEIAELRASAQGFEGAMAAAAAQTPQS